MGGKGAIRSGIPAPTPTGSPRRVGLDVPIPYPRSRLGDPKPDTQIIIQKDVCILRQESQCATVDVYSTKNVPYVHLRLNKGTFKTSKQIHLRF